MFVKQQFLNPNCALEARVRGEQLWCQDVDSTHIAGAEEPGDYCICPLLASQMIKPENVIFNFNVYAF
jgi:hypothetical protein